MTLPKSVQAELERTTQAIGLNPQDFEERSRLVDAHLDAFVPRLVPIARAALEREGLELVSSEWVADAIKVADRFLALPEHPLSAADALLAGQGVQVELQRALEDAAGMRVSDDEVLEHATELAQLLLSNWFGVLEHTMQDCEAKVLSLDFDAVPMSAKPGELLKGAEAFAVSALDASTALREYQQSLGHADGVTVLSPTLHLVRVNGSWKVARSAEEAKRQLAPAASPRLIVLGAKRRRGAAGLGLGAIEAILRTLRPWTEARPVEFWGAALHDQMALNVADEARIALAAARCISAGMVPLGLLDSTSVDPMARAKAKMFCRQVGSQVAFDIENVASPNPVNALVAATRRIPALDLTQYDGLVQLVDTASVYRTALSATGLVLAIEEPPTDAADVSSWIRTDFEKDVFQACIETTRVALEEVDQDELRVGIIHAAGLQSVKLDWRTSAWMSG